MLFPADHLFKLLLGNAWAASGMLRVLATIQHSPWASSMQSETKDLTSWIGEVHDGMYAYIVSSKSISISLSICCSVVPTARPSWLTVHH